MLSTLALLPQLALITLPPPAGFPPPAPPAGDPQLDLLTTPKVGENLVYQLSNTLAGPGVPEFLLIDFTLLPAPIVLDPLGALHLAVSPLLIILQGDGGHVWTVPVPNDPALTGLAVHAQGVGFVFDVVSGVERLSNLVSAVLAPPSVAPRFAFVANEDDDTISLLLIDPTTGKLRHAGYRGVGDRPIALEQANDAFLYALCAGAREVQGFGVDPIDGELAPLAPVALGAGAEPRDLVVSPDGGHLYVSDAATDSIHAFAIAGNGLLTPLAGSPFAVVGSGAGPQDPAGLAIDEQGRFLLVTCESANKLAVFTLDAAGAPTAEATGNTGAGPVAVTTLYQADAEPRAIVASRAGGTVNSYHLAPDGKPTVVGFVALGAGAEPVGVSAGAFDAEDAAWVSCRGLDAVVRLPLTPVGVLGAAAADLAGAGPRAVVVAADSDFAIAIYGDDNELSSAAVAAADGSLTPIAPASSPTDRMRVRSNPSDLAIVRGLGGAKFTSDRLYVANRLSKSVSQYSVNSTASVVAPLVPGTVSTAGQPNDVAIHPRLDFAYVANFLQGGGADVQVYNISAGGQATLVQSIDIGAGGESRQWTVDVGPGGQVVLAVEVIGGLVVPLTVGPGGLLTAGPSVLTGSVPRGAAIDPTGRFYYVANSLSNTLSQFAIDGTGGSLSPLSPSQVPAGAGTIGVAVDPTGRFVYAVNQADSTVSAFAVDAVGGTLAELPASPFPCGVTPSSVAVDPSGRFLITGNEFDRSLTRFAINLDPNDGTPDGSLSTLGAVAVVDVPRGLTFDAPGKHLFVSLDVTTVGGGAVDRLATYRIDTDGQLTLVDEDASGSQPRGIGIRDRVN